MNRKRILRSWWLWGLLVLFVIFVVPSLVSGGDSYHGVGTSDALHEVTSGDVTKAVVNDKEQTLQLELKDKFDGKYSKISAQYPSDATAQIYATLAKAKSAN